MNIETLYSLFLRHPSISTDTRELKPDSIFFALKGMNFDGNKFAQKAINEGCAAAVVDDKEYATNERIILVDNVLAALQQLAHHHRKQLKIPVIAITGTNGKTTSKELVQAVLMQKLNVLATKGNLNNHIGVPLTLLGMTASHQVAIVEMGANHQREIEGLCVITAPDYGMITNIGKAHLEGFGGEEGVIKAKGEMYDYIRTTGGKLFVNADNNLLKRMSFGIKRILYGSESSEADYQGSLLECDPFVKLKISGTAAVISTHLIGNYNFENMMAAACIGNHFGLSAVEIQKGLESYVPHNNRSEVMQTARNLLLLDAYNANPSSMRAAILNFAQMDRPNKVVILGDMLELGADAAQEHFAITSLVKEKNFDNIFFVGPEFSKHASVVNAFHFNDINGAIVYFRDYPISNSTVLVKGSRGIQLEKIISLF